MKKRGVTGLALAALCVLAAFAVSGCDREQNVTSAENKEEKDMESSPDKSSFIAGTDITGSDITEFYYTEENINYDAYYLRYRFYVEDDRYMFFYEERERVDDYGPATEEDTIAKVDREITEDEWKQFFDIISGGKVTARQESDEAGDSGPWTYLYWKGDKSEYQEYSFASYAKQKEFVTLCETLAAAADMMNTTGMRTLTKRSGILSKIRYFRHTGTSTM